MRQRMSWSEKELRRHYMDQNHSVGRERGTVERTVLCEPIRNGTVQGAHTGIQTQALEGFFKLSSIWSFQAKLSPGEVREIYWPLLQILWGEWRHIHTVEQCLASGIRLRLTILLCGNCSVSVMRIYSSLCSVEDSFNNWLLFVLWFLTGKGTQRQNMENCRKAESCSLWDRYA